MTVISDVISALETWAPLATQQSYDNVGLQVDDAGTGLTRAVIALDITPAVVEEAISNKAELIITHHPLIFRPLKSITSGDWHGSIILKLARAGIARGLVLWRRRCAGIPRELCGNCAGEGRGLWGALPARVLLSCVC